MTDELGAIVASLGNSAAPHGALTALYQYLMDNPSIATYKRVETELNKLDTSQLNLARVRIAVLSSFTLQQLAPILKIKSLAMGIDAEIKVGEYNQFAQEILGPESWLYAFEPDVVFLAVELADIAPPLVYSFESLDDDQKGHLCQEIISLFMSLVETLHRKIGTDVILHNFQIPAWPAAEMTRQFDGFGQIETVRKLNYSLVELTKEYPGTYVLDYDTLAARIGKDRWIDSRFWYLARMRISYPSLQYLADDYARYVYAMKGLRRKCLVVDLDNTLWGGVVGEDGISGIALGTEYPGNAYRDFQASILELYQRGIILAINSKNNWEDVAPVFANHPAVVLKQEHFASIKVNWEDKAANMGQIAADLNIGLDSMVFFDDNPVEVGRMRALVPEVRSYVLPEKPEKLPEFLRHIPDFGALTLTEEDRHRGEMYRQQAQRCALETMSASLDDFYQQLEMRATISPLRNENVSRAVQLIQRTNQFNLTTHRYSEADMYNILADESWCAYLLELEDKFGSNGTVGVAILHLANQREAWIDTLLLSCRVMNRTVEQCLLSFLSARALSLGASVLVGEYIKTAKNAVVADLYGKYGFKLLREEPDRSIWCYDLRHGILADSPYIAVTTTG